MRRCFEVVNYDSLNQQPAESSQTVIFIFCIPVDALTSLCGLRLTAFNFYARLGV